MIGHGTFVYDPNNALNEYGSAKSVVDAMIKMGMSHAWLRVHTKNGAWRSESNKLLANEIKNRGLSLGVWGWNDGNNISRDISNAKTAISSYKPDMYIADIEHGVSGANWNPQKAKTFCSAVKDELGDKPLTVSSFGYIPYHEPEIMSAVDDIADYFAPQVYWFWFPKPYMLQDPKLSDLPTNNAASYSKVSLHEWREVVTKPLILTGQAYWGEAQGWTQSQSEKKLKEFIDGFKDFDDIAGLNWWNFADSRAMSSKMEKMIAEANFAEKLDSQSLEKVVSTSQKKSKSQSTKTDRIAGERMMIAAEGLFFRESPQGGTDDNKITELDYDSSALITGDKTSNGYYPCNVEINGNATSGYLHSAYLRPLESEKIERAVSEAVSEWIRFEKGKGWETQEPYSGYINEMWTRLGYPNLTGNDTNWFWSAAYISFVLDNADYTKTKFDIRHSTYINEAIQNKVTETNGDYWGYRITETLPEVGDIICQWRDTETTYDEAEVRSKFTSHTDIVIAVRPRAIVTLGGNVATTGSGIYGVTVETKIFSLDENGQLPNKRKVFAIMKNQHRRQDSEPLLV